ncbi:MAG: hypothetical protein IT454_17880 [Planctomycetes bacterium]|nr:hypothetical protein [Planctomycetota bacterium]
MAKLSEAQFMAFDWRHTPRAQWPAELTAEQRERLGLELGKHDLKLFRSGGEDPWQRLGVPIERTDLDQFTFHYWLNYFWGEAAPSNAAADHECLLAALRKLVERTSFPIPAVGQFELGRARLRDFYRLREASDADRGEALEQLLRAGFVGMRRFIGPLPEAQVNLPFMEEFMGEPRTAADALFSRSTDRPAIYWRGEARAPEQLLEQATRRMVDIPSLAQSMNLTQPWHPFHRREIAANLWYRKHKNRDNDYFTAISVAHSFEAACCFPLINEARVYRFPSDDPWSWSPEEVRRNLEHLGVVETADHKRRIRIVTRTTVYLSSNRGARMFTEAAQLKISKAKGFPEHAVAEIRPEDIYGYLVVHRVFDNTTQSSPFTVHVDRTRSSRVRVDPHLERMVKVAAPEAERDAAQFGALAQQLEQQFARALSLPPFKLSWTANGPSPALEHQHSEHLVSPPPLEGTARGFLINKMAPALYR